MSCLRCPFPVKEFILDESARGSFILAVMELSEVLFGVAT